MTRLVHIANTIIIVVVIIVVVIIIDIIIWTNTILNRSLNIPAETGFCQFLVICTLIIFYF